MNYIIGSGLMSFLAKQVNPNYEILPVGKSRFYRYDIATCDDYIIYDKDIDGFMNQFGSINHVYFKRALSMAGQIIFNTGGPYMDTWMKKVYDDVPPIIRNWYRDGFIYNMRGSDIFKILESKCMSECKKFINNRESIKHIDTKNKIIITTHQCLDYDNIISTIPRNYLFNLCGITHDLTHRDLFTFVISTNDLDFEGASELLVVDGTIDFHKCTAIGKDQYQFYSINKISDLNAYLSVFIKKFSIMSATYIKEALPTGNPLDHLVPQDITCIGSNAQWNDLIDLSMSIKNLIN